MKRKVLTVHFDRSLKCPPFGGCSFLNGEKQPGIEIYTGVEAGFVTVTYLGKEHGIPIANATDLVWDKNNDNRLDRDKSTQTTPKES